MGVTTPAAAPPRAPAPAWRRWIDYPGVLRGLALAGVVVNVALVCSGGAVRLTGSGLGCPTWPKCTNGSLTPTKAYSFHGIIEFTNRQFGIVLGVLATVILLVAWRQGRERLLALLAFLIFPVQAVIGGITVKTDLNPWVVSLHFLASMPAIAVTLLLWWRLADRPAGQGAPLLRRYSWLLVAVTGVVLMAGTIVTGAGPHAGDKRADGTIHRNGLAPGSMAQLHADLVMILIGLTAGLVALVYATRASEGLRRAAVVLLGVELAQGVIGFVQYFTHVPALLVAVHMLGACLVWLAALAVAYRSADVSPRRSADPLPTPSGRFPAPGRSHTA